jgi:hypothetical protein
VLRHADQQPTVQLDGRIHLAALHAGTRSGQGLVQGQVNTATRRLRTA